MALGKGRRIVVDDIALRWTEASRLDRTKAKGDPAREHLLLLLQRTGAPGQRLAVVLPWGREIFANPVKPVSRPLMPSLIARCARAAIERHGWRATTPAPELVVDFAALLPGEPWPPTSRELRGKV
jgi:hypothetical protein